MAQHSPLPAAQYCLLKAEALCAELMANGVSFEEMIIRLAGAFRKSYRNDIGQVAPPKNGNGALLIELHRDGFYDVLPEGLFHQTRGGSRTRGAGAMVEEYRRFREEERQARKFFQPLEQEFFRYAVMVEQEERQLLLGMLNGKLEKDFYRFWNIDSRLPAKTAATLVLIMPWIRDIKGDPQLTARALSMILECPVTCQEAIREECSDQGTALMLGQQEMLLGMDTVCGSSVAEPYVQWTFSISGLDAAQLASFTGEAPFGLLLRRFEELFLPLDVAVCFEYHSRDTTGQTQADPVLGYGFYL